MEIPAYEKPAIAFASLKKDSSYHTRYTHTIGLDAIILVAVVLHLHGVIIMSTREFLFVYLNHFLYFGLLHIERS